MATEAIKQPLTNNTFMDFYQKLLDMRSMTLIEYELMGFINEMQARPQELSKIDVDHVHRIHFMLDCNNLDLLWAFCHEGLASGFRAWVAKKKDRASVFPI